MKRGADLVMQALVAKGVRDVFALSGNQIMPLFDASLDAGVRLYHTRHEAAALYMAEGHAQITGGVGVALVTAGAGLGNAIGPLLTARASHTPVLLLSGDSPVHQDGTGAFQEMDQVGLTQSITKWSVRPTSADTVHETLIEALHAAQSGRPGPVHVSLPADILVARSDVANVPMSTPRHLPDLSDLCDWLAEAEHPLIVLGPELNDTRAPRLSKRLRAALDAPAFAMESPRGLNDPALGAVAQAFKDADRVLVLGKPVDFTLRFGSAAPDASWSFVSADADDLAQARRALGERLVMRLDASAGAVAERLCGPTQATRRGAWCAKVDGLLAKRTQLAPRGDCILPNDICSAVQAIVNSNKNSILICDGGEFGQWAQAGVSAPRRIINGVSGAIGGGLCYALAAKAADPTATVIAMMGDGTVGFHLAEFETALREDLPFVAIIGNDQSWNADHQIQMRDYGSDRTHGCSLTDADYGAAVTAMGGFGITVDQRGDLPAALDAAISSGKPACINVKMTGLPAPVIG